MLSSNTIQFISDLQANNERPWFEANRKRYDEAIKDHNAFTAEMIRRIGSWDPSIKDLPLNKATFRIYRDVRFSKDKSPYKAHFGSFYHAWKEVDKTVELWPAGYYVHIEPGEKSFAGGGLFAPEKETLAAIRQEIDYNLSEWESIVNAPAFKAAFPKGVEGRKLQRAPKGFEPTNPGIEWIKHNEWVIGMPLPDKELTESGTIDKVEAVLKTIQPFMAFLNRPFRKG